MDAWVIYLIIGLVGFMAGWYLHTWKQARSKEVKARTLDDRQVNRMRAMMDEYEVYSDVHLHRNRSGSIAVALGECPDVWPEDMRLPDDQD